MGSASRAEKALFLERAYHAQQYAIERPVEEVSNTPSISEHTLTFSVLM